MTHKTAGFMSALEAFAADLTATFKLPVAFNPEDQLKGPVATLLKGAGDVLGLDVDTVTEVQVAELAGRPDMGITVKSLLAGHLELKAPGKGADPQS